MLDNEKKKEKDYRKENNTLTGAYHLVCNQAVYKQQWHLHFPKNHHKLFPIDS